MSEDRKNTETALTEKILSHMKGEILINFRFLDFAISYLKNNKKLTGSILFGTDGRTLVFTNRYVINEYYDSPNHMNRRVLHTLLHAIYRHPFSEKIRSGKIWDLCCDISIENMIDDLNSSFVNIAGNKLREKEYKRLSVETQRIVKSKYLLADYLYPILSNAKDTELSSLERLFYQDDHSLWGKVLNTDKEDGSSEGDNGSGDGTGEGFSSDNAAVMKVWEEISQRMVTDLETYSKNIGNMHGDFLMQLRIATRRKYDYKDFLNKFMAYREVMKESLDEFDYIYYTYGLMNYGNMPLIDSVEYKDELVLEEFVIAIDTSGSVFGSEARLFLETMYSILLQNINKRRVNIHIIQADMAIQSHDIIHNEREFHEFIDKFAMRGGGGTDFVPVFNVVNQMVLSGELNHLKGLLYFTDGMGNYPTFIPKYESVFVFFSEFMNDYAVPYWAKKLVLTKEDFIEGGHK